MSSIFISWLSLFQKVKEANINARSETLLRQYFLIILNYMLLVVVLTKIIDRIHISFLLK